MSISIVSRYNWCLVLKSNKYLCWFVLVSLVVWLFCLMWLWSLEQVHKRMDAERSTAEVLSAHFLLKADVYRLVNFGAPGTTTTDWIEGTEKDFELRDIKQAQRDRGKAAKSMKLAKNTQKPEGKVEPAVAQSNQSGKLARADQLSISWKSGGK